jgi:uncharacterized RDD family membrane protein YckC
MKCPKCGFTNNRSGSRCLSCGTSFREKQQLTIEPEQVQQPAQTVPDWRKEVTRKAREYGERKKYLTTPPRPLKEHVHEPQPEQHESIRTSVEVAAAVEPGPPPIAPEVFSPPLKPSHPPLPREPQPRRRLELDVTPEVKFPIEVEPEATEEPSLYIGRRFLALLIDHAIMLGLAFALMFFFRQVLSYDLKTKFESAWLPIIGAILLFHFLYYFYFHKTSRQTPGLLFLSLEIRNPSSSSISASKIITRWAALVFLNVFNLVPFFLGKNFLLLDLLSETEVRSFKDKNLVFNHEGHE